MNTNLIVAVPAPRVIQDRTYTSAQALGKWFAEHGGAPTRITVLTSGAHSRRSRLLFQKALGKDVQVGTIAVVPEDYDPARWWGSSAGVRVVVGEVLAYGYARLIFRP
jgi:uncharacterized SAM-binding protein YcdF (DUF218 family)